MNQSELNRAVAKATGETPRVISERGFSLADPASAEHDPEPSEVEDLIVDWDNLALERNVPLTSQRSTESAAA
jgi:hypothetical protein